MRVPVRFLVLLLGVVLPGAMLLGLQRWVDSLGRELGGSAAMLLQAAALPRPPLEPAPALPLPIEAQTPEATLPQVEEDVLPLRAANPASGKRRTQPSTQGPSVRISARQVLTLAQASGVPHAVPVAASARHPAGLRLSGVASLGIGMQDGDVLTRVAGVPVSAVSQVTELVLRARSRHVPEMAAEFWRQGARGLLVVEQPYLHSAMANASETRAAP